MSDVAVPSRTEALEILQGDRTRTEALLAGLAPGDMERTGLGGGDWAPKDLVGHLESCEQDALDALAAWDRGDTAPIEAAIRTLGVDEVNRGEVERKASMSTESVTTSAAATHERLIDALAALDDGRWASFPNRTPTTTTRLAGGSGTSSVARKVCPPRPGSLARSRDVSGRLSALVGGTNAAEGSHGRASFTHERSRGGAEQDRGDRNSARRPEAHRCAARRPRAGRHGADRARRWRLGAQGSGRPSRDLGTTRARRACGDGIAASWHRSARQLDTLGTDELNRREVERKAGRCRPSRSRPSAATTHGRLLDALEALADDRWAANPEPDDGTTRIGRMVGSDILGGTQRFVPPRPGSLGDLETFRGRLSATGCAHAVDHDGRAEPQQGLSWASAHSLTRTHPAEALVPIDDGSFVPWIASWLPPVHPAGRCGWIPLIPNANVPSALPGRERHAVRDDVLPRRGGRPRRTGGAGHREQDVVVLVQRAAMLGQVDVDVHEGRRRAQTRKRDPAVDAAATRRGAPRGPTCRARSSRRPRQRAARGSTSSSAATVPTAGADVHGLRRATIPPLGTSHEHARGVPPRVRRRAALRGAARPSAASTRRRRDRRVLGAGMRALGRNRRPAAAALTGARRRDRRRPRPSQRGRRAARCPAPQPMTSVSHGVRRTADRSPSSHARSIGAVQARS